MNVRYEDFDLEQLCQLNFLKVLAQIPPGADIRLSKSGQGIHIRMSGSKRNPVIHALSCEGWQFWSQFKGLVWKSPFVWLTLTEELRTSLIGHRDPLVALEEAYYKTQTEKRGIQT